LVCTKDMRHPVLIEKFVNNARSKGIPSTTEVMSEYEKCRCSRCVYRGEMAKSSFSGSGSDQTRSAMGPSCGISDSNVSK